MKFFDFINESTSLLVIDVQPAHSQFISFNIFEFTEYLNSYNGTINYVFNGPDQGYEDETELADWLTENGLEYETLDNINFIAKSYGWIRDPMDSGMDEDDIIEVLKYMIKKKYSDSRDIDEDELETLKISDEFKEYMEQSSFGLPDILKKMQKLPKSILVGGGETECLLEMEITMDAMGIKYKRNNKFIY